MPTNTNQMKKQLEIQLGEEKKEKPYNRLVAQCVQPFIKGHVTVLRIKRTI